MQKSKSTLVETGDLRQFLAECIVELKSGDLDIQQAAAIVKTAGQINASFNAEVESMRLMHQLGRQVPEIGHVPLK